ncbi:DUF2804 domain-containing protein [Breznakiellaceae bacterium SP9]
MAQIEISAPVSILNAALEPEHFGWARQPLFVFDPSLITANRSFITESDRYIIFSPTHLAIFDVFDHGVFGYAGLSLISLKDNQRTTHIFTKLLTLGALGLPASSSAGRVHYQKQKALLDFVCMSGGARIIKVDFPRFTHNRSLRGAVVLSPPPLAESIVTHQGWTKQKAFRLTQRSPWYTVEGVIQFGTTELNFTKGKAWGIFDWNRGIRPREDLQYWASACGMANGMLLSFSLGYSTSNSTLGTENAFFIDAKLSKFNEVTFHISPSNWLLPWRFTSDDKRLEMEFVPSHEWVERKFILFHSLRRRQSIGHFSGKLILEGNKVLEFQQLTGFVERRKTRF